MTVDKDRSKTGRQKKTPKILALCVCQLRLKGGVDSWDLGVTRKTWVTAAKA
jgi:hypothetical protein